MHASELECRYADTCVNVCVCIYIDRLMHHPPTPSNSTLAKLNISNVCQPIFSHSQSPIKDSSNDNLVSKQTSSPTYLILQLHLHQRQQQQQSCLHPDFQSHLSSPTATSRDSNHNNLVSKQTSVPLTLFYSYTSIKDGSHDNLACEWRTHSALHLDAQGHVLSGCKRRLPSHKHNNMFDK